MSVRIMSAIWESGPADQAECMLLLALADMADDDGICWPAMATVADRARMSERNARRVVRRLEDAGWLVTDGQRGRHNTNRYRVTKPDEMSAKSDIKPDTTSARTKCPPGQNEHENRTTATQKPDTAMSAEPSRTIKEPSDKSLVREALRSVLSERAADDFIAHRKALKKPLTLRAAQLIAGDLISHPDPDGVVNASIKNGWQGVFPEKSKPPPRPTTDLDAAFAQFGLPPMRTTQ